MNASLQRVSNNPATYVLRVHPDGGSWREEAPYSGSATVTFYGAVAVMRGLSTDDWSVKTKSAVLRAIDKEGVSALIGTHKGRLWVWLTSTRRVSDVLQNDDRRDAGR